MKRWHRRSKTLTKRSTSGDQVVHQHSFTSRFDCTDMHFNTVRAVFGNIVSMYRLSCNEIVSQSGEIQTFIVKEYKFINRNHDRRRYHAIKRILYNLIFNRTCICMVKQCMPQGPSTHLVTSQACAEEQMALSVSMLMALRK